jgi:hypothetical protein
VTGLMGKVLRWDSPDNDYYTISRFDEDLGGGFWLAARLAPIGGGDLGSYHVVSLSELSNYDGADIYDNFEAFRRGVGREPAAVLRLVERSSTTAAPQKSE